MPTFIINSDLTASNDEKKPERGRLTKAEYRDVLKRWTHKNKYYVANIELNENAIGNKFTGELRGGFLYIDKMINE